MKVVYSCWQFASKQVHDSRRSGLKGGMICRKESLCKLEGSLNRGNVLPSERCQGPCGSVVPRLFEEFYHIVHSRVLALPFRDEVRLASRIGDERISGFVHCNDWKKGDGGALKIFESIYIHADKFGGRGDRPSMDPR